MNKFCKNYLSLLVGKYKGLNLTRITGEEEFYYKQYLDSVKPIQDTDLLQEKLERCKLLVDIGFGGGFPILPLADVMKQVDFLGFDARAKKAKAVQEIAHSLNLENVKLMHSRIEDVYFDRECVFTVKAVGKIVDIIDKVHTRKDNMLVFYKGPNVRELENVPEQRGQWKLIYEKLIPIQDTDGRFIFVYQKLDDVPCGTKSRRRALSSFLKENVSD